MTTNKLLVARKGISTMLKCMNITNKLNDAHNGLSLPISAMFGYTVILVGVLLLSTIFKTRCPGREIHHHIRSENDQLMFDTQKVSKYFCLHCKGIICKEFCNILYLCKCVQ